MSSEPTTEKKIRAGIERSLALVHPEDRPALEEYLLEKESAWLASGNPRFFFRSYYPYRYLVVDRKSFYDEAIISFYCFPEEKEDRIELGWERYRLDETLYMLKSDGRIYYDAYTRRGIPVADSLAALWNYYRTVLPEESKRMDEIAEEAQWEGLDEERRATLARYFRHENLGDVLAIYDFLGKYKASEDDSFFCFQALREQFRFPRISKENFFKRSSFDLYFPLKPFEYETPSPLPLLNLGMENEDEDTGPADAMLLYSPDLRAVLRVGGSGLDGRSLKELGSEATFAREGIENRPPTIPERKSIRRTIWKIICDTFSRRASVYDWDYEIISDTLADFLAQVKGIEATAFEMERAND